jgi:hypothetical protein
MYIYSIVNGNIANKDLSGSMDITENIAKNSTVYINIWDVSTGMLNSVIKEIIVPISPQRVIISSSKTFVELFLLYVILMALPIIKPLFIELSSFFVNFLFLLEVIIITSPPL